MPAKPKELAIEDTRNGTSESDVVGESRGIAVAELVALDHNSDPETFCSLFPLLWRSPSRVVIAESSHRGGDIRSAKSSLRMPIELRVPLGFFHFPHGDGHYLRLVARHAVLLVPPRQWNYATHHSYTYRWAVTSAVHSLSLYGQLSYQQGSFPAAAKKLWGRIIFSWIPDAKIRNQFPVMRHVEAAIDFHWIKDEDPAKA